MTIIIPLCHNSHIYDYYDNHFSSHIYDRCEMHIYDRCESCVLKYHCV